jgi:hypothetical protein
MQQWVLADSSPVSRLGFVLQLGLRKGAGDTLKTHLEFFEIITLFDWNLLLGRNAFIGTSLE